MSIEMPAQGAAVRFPLPPLLFGVPLVGALALGYAVPLDIPGRPATTVIGAALTLAGVVFSLSGAATALRHRTTLAPHHPVATLMTTGPFRFSRNPMYTGHAASLVGAALWAGTWWPMIVVPFCMLLTYRLAIDPEEDYLADRFGAKYASYQARVRRWL